MYNSTKELRNAAGIRKIQKTKLEYSEAIVSHLLRNPENIGEVIAQMEVSEEDFFDYLSGNKEANIVFYDQALILSMELSKEKEQYATSDISASKVKTSERFEYSEEPPKMTK